MQRRTYLFSGHVQGVGFRYTARAVASTRPVSGYVRNMPDGRVEMVMEGEPADMDAVVQRLQEQMEGHISRMIVQESPALGDLVGFEVRH